MPSGADLTRAYQDLVRIVLTLSRETDLPVLLERILGEARQLTSAEAGTLYLLEAGVLHFTVVQNDALARRLGVDGMKRCLQAAPLRLDEASLAGHVAATGDILNLHDAHMIPPDRPYGFDDRVDARCQYRTQSMLVVPLPDPSGQIVGVLQLINALGREGRVAAFDPQYEGLVRSLASQAAVAIRNARLEALALKDTATEAYHRRYLLARLEEECRRSARTGQPVSLVLADVDHFEAILDGPGLAAGNELLSRLARLLLRHSRNFTVVSRYGSDRFAMLLVDTPKAGALAYAERIRGVVAAHALPSGPLTASFGVACLPDDAASAEELRHATERAVVEAKRLGRNRVVAP